MRDIPRQKSIVQPVLRRTSNAPLFVILDLQPDLLGFRHQLGVLPNVAAPHRVHRRLHLLLIGFLELLGWVAFEQCHSFLYGRLPCGNRFVDVLAGRERLQSYIRPVYASPDIPAAGPDGYLQGRSSSPRSSLAYAWLGKLFSFADPRNRPRSPSLHRFDLRTLCSIHSFSG